MRFRPFVSSLEKTQVAPDREIVILPSEIFADLDFLTREVDGGSHVCTQRTHLSNHSRSAGVKPVDPTGWLRPAWRVRLDPDVPSQSDQSRWISFAKFY